MANIDSDGIKTIVSLKMYKLWLHQQQWLTTSGLPSRTLITATSKCHKTIQEQIFLQIGLFPALLLSIRTHIVKSALTTHYWHALAEEKQIDYMEYQNCLNFYTTQAAGQQLWSST